ncbi:MAG: hypothetical protein HYW49_10075 [Deltaproteobacteria bacterium]|nr:hypothetical protein [Deltaproteobacteria bacterium]
MKKNIAVLVVMLGIGMMAGESAQADRPFTYKNIDQSTDHTSIASASCKPKPNVRTTVRCNTFKTKALCDQVPQTDSCDWF